MTSRMNMNNIATRYFSSEECRAILEEHKAVFRTPKSIMIKSSEITTKENIQELMDKEEITYPVVLKGDITYNSKYAHSKHFIHRLEDFSNAFNDEAFLKENWIIQELVPHSEDMLIKIHCFSNQTMFWRVDYSIPAAFHESSAFIDSKYDLEILTKDPHSKCIHFEDEVEGETRLDVRLFQKVLMGT